ncbi:MAG: HAMP domain-containing histidine kinase [Oscillibacter sp.]|nr:HAMP domain-containing histidine kinase [Oscillibacter sp.]
MDTKWNDMDRQPEREYYAASLVKREDGSLREGVPAERVGRVKPWISFLAFFLGVTLVIFSAGNALSRIVWERDPFPRFVDDWQETDSFHTEVSSYLRDFLTIAVGGTPDFYTASYWTENDTAYGTAITEENPGILDFIWQRPRSAMQEDTGTVTYYDYGDGFAQSSSRPPAEPAKEREPDADYQHDKNVLYYILRNKEGDAAPKTYTNTKVPYNGWRKAPEYNFFLTFKDGKVSISKDGQELDVYGDGVYDADSLWFVPGYDNFPVSDQLEGVEVHMAIRKEPIRWYGVDYQTGNTYYNSSMYYIARNVEQSRNFYRAQVFLFSCGVLLLMVWVCLRKARVYADRRIASWTVRVWTEVRVLLGLIAAFMLLFEANWLPEFYYSFRDVWYSWDCGWGSLGMPLLRAAVSSVPALLFLFWMVWLVRNDHRYNPKEARRSLLRPLFRRLRARDLNRPVEKRLSRNWAAGMLALAILAAAEAVNWIVLFVRMIGYRSIHIDGVMLFIQLPLAILSIPLAFAVYSVWKGRNLARDIGRLADKVEAIRAGDLTNPLLMPEDTDLRQTVDSLNDIQAGMKAALEEQTRSERMKVELVSNVSHDLKTPLTSILSYAELLRQEDLSPAAADYARIIDEKAQRLKTMVQDVFEVSKAAADQLPIQMERLDLAKLLRQTLADMDAQIQKSALTFKVDLPEDPVMITADGKRLYRVFQNLIDNALRYALEGSRVYLTLKPAGGKAEASVRNTSRSELPEGVDFTARFVRGDSSRTDGGSGLGLSIASSFTEACGGEFRVETVADLFTAIVTFPLS